MSNVTEEFAALFFGGFRQKFAMASWFGESGTGVSAGRDRLAASPPSSSAPVQAQGLSTPIPGVPPPHRAPLFANGTDHSDDYWKGWDDAMRASYDVAQNSVQIQKKDDRYRLTMRIYQLMDKLQIDDRAEIHMRQDRAWLRQELEDLMAGLKSDQP